MDVTIYELYGCYSNLFQIEELYGCYSNLFQIEALIVYIGVGKI